MLLNITPSGNEIQRNMLLNHSSKMRNLFWSSLLLVPLAIWIGIHYSNANGSSESSSLMQNVAMIIVDNGGNYVSQGTAFLVANSDGDKSGYLLTARHVVAGTVSEQVRLMFPKIIDENENPLITTASIVWATEVGFDGNDLQTLRYDVAMLKLDDMSVLPEEVFGFNIGTEMEMQDPVTIYGFPSAEGYVNNGVISNIEYGGSKDLMTLGFQIDHGLSGAPVYSEETGEALGIAIASSTQTTVANIALKLSRVMELLDQDGKKGLLE